jgi:ATP-dependent protease ClpP protease subunit
MTKPIWSRVLDEITQKSLQDQQRPPVLGQSSQVDIYRRSKIKAIQDLTVRPLIVYATACTVSKQVHPAMLMIEPGDMTGFQAVTQQIKGKKLDILLHSPGGYPDATEALVKMLRRQFNDIRFIIPAYAKSAATMLAMSGNEILMAPDAELGPIDPQMRTANGTSPAIAILELFQKAQAEIAADPPKLAAWMPILSQMGPSLIIDCDNAIKLSGELVETWAREYMLAGEQDAGTKAKKIADYLGDHKNFKSHGRAIKIPELLAQGVKVKDLSTMGATLYEAVTILYSCLDIMLSNSGLYKLFENADASVVRQLQQMIMQPFMQQMPLPTP